jgi:hypothetical protein
MRLALEKRPPAGLRWEAMHAALVRMQHAGALEALSRVLAPGARLLLRDVVAEGVEERVVQGREGVLEALYELLHTLRLRGGVLRAEPVAMLNGGALPRKTVVAYAVAAARSEYSGGAALVKVAETVTWDDDGYVLELERTAGQFSSIRAFGSNVLLGQLLDERPPILVPKKVL